MVHKYTLVMISNCCLIGKFLNYTGKAVKVIPDIFPSFGSAIRELSSGIDRIEAIRVSPATFEKFPLVQPGVLI